MSDDDALTLPDLLACLAGIARSMREEFDPQRFLDEFAECMSEAIPHDRLVVDYLDEDGRTFTVFAEHVAHGPVLHASHYTTRFEREGRYAVDEWTMRSVFAGEPMLVTDLATDARFADGKPVERGVHEAGIRSALLVPLATGGRVIGALSITSLAPHTYTDLHLARARRVAEFIAPFIENAVLLERERRRRRRLGALEGLTRVLGRSLNVADIFERLADEVRPVLDFDVMGVGVLASGGRDFEMLAEVDNAPGPSRTPARMPLEHFSFAPRLEAGEVVVIHDARDELVPALPGDRLILDDGGCAIVAVPLWFGERVAGALYFGKRRASWFDAADVEIAVGIAAHVALAVQHQRLAEEQRRLVQAEERARQLEERVEALSEALGERFGFERIIGRAPALREALARAARVAPTDTTVLVTGESGTGKEIVARAIHAASQRAGGPFVAVSCAALPESLLESELFGHERGAFTGADRQKAGRFELARGGTLLLDEIGELSPAVQVKLLRVLQERSFERVGGTATLAANVRVVAATNRDLERATERGTFRQDLYYRLNVFPLHLPPLRERGDDVLLLADHFVRELALRMGKADVGLSREARAALLAHTWPGNIRELQNAVERALILSDGGLITAAQLGLTRRSDARESPDRPGHADRPEEARPPARETFAAPPPSTVEAPSPIQSLADWERRIVVDALASAKGNRSKAAKMLGLTRSQLYTRLKRFGLD
jgi:transcriptional regulator with GAF, ATPase, and Fis domain